MCVCVCVCEDFDTCTAKKTNTCTAKLYCMPAKTYHKFLIHVWPN